MRIWDEMLQRVDEVAEGLAPAERFEALRALLAAVDERLSRALSDVEAEIQKANEAARATDVRHLSATKAELRELFEAGIGEGFPRELLEG